MTSSSNSYPPHQRYPTHYQFPNSVTSTGDPFMGDPIDRHAVYYHHHQRHYSESSVHSTSSAPSLGRQHQRRCRRRRSDSPSSSRPTSPSQSIKSFVSWSHPRKSSLDISSLKSLAASVFSGNSTLGPTTQPTVQTHPELPTYFSMPRPEKQQQQPKGGGLRLLMPLRSVPMISKPDCLPQQQPLERFDSFRSVKSVQVGSLGGYEGFVPGQLAVMNHADDEGVRPPPMRLLPPIRTTPLHVETRSFPMDHDKKVEAMPDFPFGMPSRRGPVSAGVLGGTTALSPVPTARKSSLQYSPLTPRPCTFPTITPSIPNAQQPPASL
ncbi:hypothetical protein DFS34DRAFT_598617 [Phlyctochytrium arcticum]|nr:hypothetical protein DFS34DRAFT_598617 [Phlyctochytrium arcticum]